ncbi:MAG: hypothetical protein ACI4KH_00725 [Oscillospiraceae bacterium]
MSKKDRMAKKPLKMEMKKQQKLQKKKERLDVLKVFGICLCFFAIVVFGGTLYITADYRAQKSVVDKYFNAVQNMDYDALIEVTYPGTADRYAEYSDDENFKEYYMNYVYGYLKSGYDNGFKLKYKIKARYNYSDMLMQFYKINAEGILVDVKVTSYNSDKSQSFDSSVSLAKQDGKWYVAASDIEAEDMYLIDIRSKYEASK